GGAARRAAARGGAERRRVGAARGGGGRAGGGGGGAVCPPAVNDGAGTAADVTPSTLPEPSSPRRRVPGDLRRGVMAVVTPAPEPVVGRDAFLDDLHRQPGGFEDDPDALLFGQEGGVLRLGADEGPARGA